MAVVSKQISVTGAAAAVPVYGSVRLAGVEARGAERSTVKVSNRSAVVVYVGGPGVTDTTGTAIPVTTGTFTVDLGPAETLYIYAATTATPIDCLVTQQ